MAARIITVIVGVPLIFAAIWFGFPWLVILTAFVAVVGVWEFSRLVQGLDARPLLPLSVLWAVAFVLNGHWGGEHTAAVVSGGFLLSLAWFAIRSELSVGRDEAKPMSGMFPDWAATVLGPFYLGWTLSYALLLHDLPQGREWLLLVVSGTFATDTAAFFVGHRIGRHQMAPTISPGKTWEGAVGGFVGAILITVGLSALFSLPIAWWLALVAGGTIGIVAEVGDLAESWLKRSAGLKEAGQLLPGHGGVLDRLDSVVFTLVTLYYVIGWMTR